MIRSALRYPSGPGIPKRRLTFSLVVATLLMADHHDRTTLETANSPDHCRIVGE